MLRNLTYAFKSSSYVYPLVRLPLNGMRYSTKGPKQKGPTEEKLTQKGPTKERPNHEGLPVEYIKCSLKYIINDLEKMQSMVQKKNFLNLGGTIKDIMDKTTRLRGKLEKASKVIVEKDK
ncbi:unnamed protein product [Nezara viridula]|uniref:Uncharacterized protein n=1 Tax=Nezara viridula TaxID=85310 RepID=A0A9P0HHJ3_NEZVI|nr:unnamed protein product [Nezara viridula]